MNAFLAVTINSDNFDYDNEISVYSNCKKVDSIRRQVRQIHIGAIPNGRFQNRFQRDGFHWTHGMILPRNGTRFSTLFDVIAGCDLVRRIIFKSWYLLYIITIIITICKCWIMQVDFHFWLYIQKLLIVLLLKKIFFSYQFKIFSTCLKFFDIKMKVPWVCMCFISVTIFI